MNRSKALKARFAVAAVSIFVTAGCNSNTSKNQGSSEPQVPQFDGLNLVQPQFDTEGLNKLEKTLIDDPRKAARENSAALEQQLKQVQETMSSLKARIQTIDAKLESQQQQAKSLNEKLSQDLAAKAPHYKIIAEFDQNKNSDLEVFEIDNDNYLAKFHPDLHKSIETARAKIASLQTQLSSLKKEQDGVSSLTNFFTGKKEKINAQLKPIEENLKAEKNNEANLVAQKNDLLYADLANIKNSSKPTGVLAENERLNSESAAFKKERDLSEMQLQDFEKQRVTLSNQLRISQTASTSNTKEIELLKRKQEAIQAVQNKESALHHLLQVQLQRHLNQSSEKNLNLHSLKENLLSISNELNDTSVRDLKNSYEKIIADKFHQGNLLIYNKRAVSVTDIISRNRVQCYSGTTLFLLLNELLSSPRKNTVVILTEGHILPGFIDIEAGEMTLFGIETTQSGKAVVNYGATKSISGAIRVFDAHQFLLIEALGQEIKNLNEVYAGMLATTAKYGFDTKELYPLDLTTLGQRGNEALNSSLLGFGVPNTQDGDIAREESADINLNMMFRKKASTGMTAETAPTQVARMEKRAESCISMFKARKLRYEALGYDKALENGESSEFCEHEGQLTTLTSFIRYGYTYTDFKKCERVDSSKNYSKENGLPKLCVDSERRLIFYEDYRREKMEQENRGTQETEDAPAEKI